MTKWIVTGFAALLAAGATMIAPAAAGPERRTEMVDDGKAVDSLLLRYNFDATWVLDAQKIMLRDTYRDHYLLTLKKPCGWIELSNPFTFFPALRDRVRASLRYDVRDNLHAICDIAKIEKISSQTAKELRAKPAG